VRSHCSVEALYFTEVLAEVLEYSTRSAVLLPRGSTRRPIEEGVMFQLVAQTATAPQVAQANDGVTNFFVMLAVGAFVVVVLRLVRVGELGIDIATVGSVLAAVVVIAVVSLLLFVVLLGFHALLPF
jgi:hypothetical protein